MFQWVCFLVLMHCVNARWKINSKTHGSIQGQTGLLVAFMNIIAHHWCLSLRQHKMLPHGFGPIWIRILSSSFRSALFTQKFLTHADAYDHFKYLLYGGRTWAVKCNPDLDGLILVFPLSLCLGGWHAIGIKDSLHFMSLDVQWLPFEKQLIIFLVIYIFWQNWSFQSAGTDSAVNLWWASHISNDDATSERSFYLLESF